MCCFFSTADAIESENMSVEVTENLAKAAKKSHAGSEQKADMYTARDIIRTYIYIY